MEYMTNTTRERLVQQYKHLKLSGEPVLFKSGSEFVKWAADSGYEYGMKLKKINPDGPWSPINCQWKSVQLHPSTVKNYEKRAMEWDAFIIPLREKFQKAIENMERIDEENRQKEIKIHRETHWIYEHPDLVREGIVWTG